jgi:hypothetical protein
LLARAAVATLALLGPAGPALAQPAPTPPAAAAVRADPLDAQAVVPPVRFNSVFAPYLRMGETPVGSWREANDTVTQIGGWRAYAREANPPPAPPANAASGAAPVATPPGHGHHAPK